MSLSLLWVSSSLFSSTFETDRGRIHGIAHFKYWKYHITSKLEILLQLARVCNYYICVTCNTVAVISSDVLCVYRSRGVLWCRGPPLFDHRTMHKDDWNSIWFQPTPWNFCSWQIGLPQNVPAEWLEFSFHTQLSFFWSTHILYISHGG